LLEYIIAVCTRGFLFEALQIAYEKCLICKILFGGQVIWH